MSFNIIVTVYRYFFNFTLHYGQDYRPSYRLCGGDICMTIMILLSICFVFSLLVSFIYQTIVNHNLINIFSLPDYDLLFESPIEIGDDVYDLYTGLIAKYCGDCLGDDNNIYIEKDGGYVEFKATNEFKAYMHGMKFHINMNKPYTTPWGYYNPST